MDLENVLLPNDTHDRPLRALDISAATWRTAATPHHTSAAPSLRPELPRPASYTSLPHRHEDGDASFSFSEDDLVPVRTSWSHTATVDEGSAASQGQGEYWPSPHVYSKPPNTSPDSRITVQRTLFVSDPDLHRQLSPHDLEPALSSTGQAHAAHAPRKPKRDAQDNIGMSGRDSPPKTSSFAKTPSLGRTSQTFHDASLSLRVNAETVTQGQTGAPGRAGRLFGRESSSTSAKTPNKPPKEDKAPSRALSKGRSMLIRRSSKAPTSAVEALSSGADTQAPTDSTKRPVTPLLKSFSNNNLPSLSRLKEPHVPVPALPSTISTDRLSLLKERPLKKRDELWAPFRSLDSDYSRFHSKSIALKANVVRSSLLPFLHDFAQHPSNTDLRPEDLDRRTSILNKWWTGLLSLLRSRNGNSIAGSDRPVILEAIAAIMERGEWRYPPSSFAPVAERAERSHHSRAESTASASSDDFLLESVHHNVRNIYVQNLFAQMDFVVDKMSLKHAPASLVAFCGKACAYAFLFCPGIADILVRLWDVKPQNIRKIVRISNVESRGKLNSAAEVAVLNFPHAVRSLVFTSTKAISKVLRKAPVLPLGVDKLQWHGNWLTRWSGRDSELFYTFTRYFHELVLDFLPPESTPEDRIVAPGQILVQAQMLSNLQSTIHRPSSHALEDSGTAATVTFEEILNADSSAVTIPSSPINAARMMSENRLVLLLKDLVSMRSAADSSLTKLFVASFCLVLQAAVRSISLYDQTACFTLCDFLQEALTILIPHQVALPDQEPPLDWSFITDVFKRMVDSQNTTTEIRLYAMIFSIWDSIGEAQTWRDQLSLNFLLDRDHFLSAFNHWCPMVRAYYMRLLCWRLGRYDGDATDNEVRILKTLTKRLQEAWAFHKNFENQSRKEGTLLPSTAPCNPAPGRKLLIIRTDTQKPTPLLSFQNIISAAEDSEETARSPATESPPDGPGMTAGSLLERVSATLEYGVHASRRRSSLLRSLWTPRATESRSRSQSPRNHGSASASPRASKEHSRRSSPNRNGTRSSLYEQRPSQWLSDSSIKHTKDGPQDQNQPNYIHAEFKFSLQSIDRKPQAMAGDLTLDSPKLPLAAQLLLESQATTETDRDASIPESRCASTVRYAGRALAEWTWVVNECQNFFERRRNEGVLSNRQVETPLLSVEPFRRPG